MVAPDSSLPDTRRPAAEPLRTKFQDFNDETTFQSLRRQAVDAAALNFVVHFGKEKAQMALDLSDKELGAFLQSEDPEYPVRWMYVPSGYEPFRGFQGWC